ncbi:MAG: hypothetical protein U0271_05805 [Polyangiaceae bacterium]
MLQRFLNKSMPMSGIDYHTIEAPMTPCLVLAGEYWTAMKDKLTPTVTADFFPMVREGHELWLVPHITAPATPEGLVILALTIAGSSSKPALTKCDVTGMGSPLAISTYDHLGTHLDCSSIGVSLKLPTGMILALSTVVTQATFEDYANSAVNMWVDNIWSALIDTTAGKIAPSAKDPSLWKYPPKEVFAKASKDLCKWALKQVRDTMKDLVTSAVDASQAEVAETPSSAEAVDAVLP